LVNANEERLLVIYGGRNDSIFANTKNVALNDICIFNVNLKQWISLVIYGTHPCSRWSHLMVPNRGWNADGMLVFGGVNLNNYCKSRLHTFLISNYGPSRDRKSSSASPKAARNNLSIAAFPDQRNNLVAGGSPSKAELNADISVLMGKLGGADGGEVSEEDLETDCCMAKRITLLQSGAKEKIDALKTLFDKQEGDN